MPLPLQELASRHPLFNRLTGQVIWLLFEERGIEPPVIDAFMGRYLAWRERHLEILRPVLEQRAEDTPYIQIQTRPGSGACASCASLNGLILPVGSPLARNFLPPYSLGCRTSAVLLSRAAFNSLPNPRLVDDTIPLPRPKLHCDDDWIFHADWTGPGFLP